MTFRCLMIFIIVAFASCSKYANLAENVSYMNPLLPTGGDPWVIQKDSFYYYTNTSLDRIEIWKTKSISRLSNAVRKTVWMPTANTSNCYDIWAPELHYLDGKWYIYYSAGPTHDAKNQRLFVLENPSPDPLEGTWEDKGQIADPAADIYAIDGTVLELNKKRYLIWSSLPADNYYKQAIFIAEMSNPWTLASSRVLISSPDFDWERIGSEAGNGVNEGPEVLINSKGEVFLVYSASGCWTDGYGLGLLFLKDGADPMKASDWVKHPSRVFGTREGSFAYGPGHNAFFKSPDGQENWIIYCANLKPNQSCGLFRNPRIQKFSWNDDGTPNFGEPVPAFRRLLRPSGEKD